MAGWCVEWEPGIGAGDSEYADPSALPRKSWGEEGAVLSTAEDICKDLHLEAAQHCG